jgi:hypothetical protein
MFDLWCPVAGCAVLRWPSDVVTVTHPGPGEIDVLLRCDCGQLAMLRTGRGRQGREQVVHGVRTVTPDRTQGAVPDGQPAHVSAAR